MHDRRDRIEERQRVFVGQFADRVRQRRRGQRTGRDDDVAPVRRRQAVDFGPMNFDQGMVVQRLGDGGGKSVAVDRQRAAGGNLVGVGRAHDQRTQPAHFGVQQSDRIVGGVVGAERVGAHEFGQAIGAMGFGHPAGAHLVQDDAERRHLATCQAASEPARPAPTICTGSEEDLMAVIATEVARFPAQWNARAPVDTTTPAAKRALSVRR